MSLTSLIPTGEEFCVLRTQVVDTLLACHDGDGALLYLYLIRKGSCFEERSAMHELGLTRDRYDRAVHTLTKLQLVSAPNQPQTAPTRTAKPPRYTAAEMRARREGDHRFASVCQTAESVLGRTLTDGQLRTMMTVYEYLQLPADVIVDLLMYLKREKGVVSRRDIEEQAYLWADMGIFTEEAATAFLARREQEKPKLQAMLRALNMSGRDPAPNEYRMLSGFIRQGFDADAVSLAAERMYAQLGQFSWKYLKGILDSWDSKGLHTASEITAAEPHKRRPTGSNSSASQQQPGTGLADWEREWMEEFRALKKEASNGV